MTIFRQPISNRLTLSTQEGHPGGLGVTIDNGGVALVYSTFLTPEEADQLALSALGLTKPEHMDPNAEEDYQAAMEAVRVWQATRAARESVRQRDAERDAVLWEAGYRSLRYAKAGPAVQFLVDKLIEARKVGQK